MNSVCNIFTEICGILVSFLDLKNGGGQSIPLFWDCGMICEVLRLSIYLFLDLTLLTFELL